MKYAVVNKSIGTIKSEPKELSENIDEVLFGMNVEIIKELEDNWFYIKTHYNYKGYINGENLLINDKIAKSWEEEKNSIVINNFADVLNKSEASGYVIATMTRGANITSTNEVSANGRFIKVKIPNGEYGWVRRNFIADLKTDYDVNNEELLRDNLMKSALSYIGTQYRWGGKTPKGIDCSGLCSMAYMLNGIIIYRDANIKDKFPIKQITKDKLKKADLIFFKGHVAMYLGNEKYIHSSTSNDVVMINSFNKSDNEYYEYLDKASKEFGSIF